MIVEGARRALSRVPAYHGFGIPGCGRRAHNDGMADDPADIQNPAVVEKEVPPERGPARGRTAAMFVANRDRVRSWLDDWDFPEVAWPMASAIPSPWVVAPGPQQMWFEQHAPHMPQYW